MKKLFTTLLLFPPSITVAQEVNFTKQANLCTSLSVDRVMLIPGGLLFTTSTGECLIHGYSPTSSNNYSEPTIVPELQNSIAVVNSQQGALVLKSDGTVTLWRKGVANKIKRLNNVIQISSIANHMLALKKDGSVWAWGDNLYKQCSADAKGESYYEYPIKIRLAKKAVQVAAGYWFSMVLHDDGTVTTWGDNRYGTLGTGLTYNANNDSLVKEVPTEIPTLKGVIAISASERHALALTKDGCVWSWGDREFGKLGDGLFYKEHGHFQYIPMRLNALPKAVAIATGRRHSVILGQDGTVWAWGDNYRNQVGNEKEFKDRIAPSPVPVPIPPKILKISCGEENNLAIDAEGHIWTWGSELMNFSKDRNSYYYKPLDNPSPVLLQHLTVIKSN